MDTAEIDVRTRSTATAAALMLLGHEPIGVRPSLNGPPVIRFAPSAETDLRRFLVEKQRADQLVAAVDGAQKK